VSLKGVVEAVHTFVDKEGRLVAGMTLYLISPNTGESGRNDYFYRTNSVAWMYKFY